MKSLKWLAASLFILGNASTVQAAETATEDFSTRTYEIVNIDSALLGTSERFGFDSGLTFEYPDAVRGIFVTGNSAGGARFSSLVDLVGNTDLNAMVIDVKEDVGHLTYTPKADSPLADKGIGTSLIKDPHAMLKRMEQEQIYPIARVVVFKDTVLAEQHPELSFTTGGQLWTNGRGEAFVNPFMKEVWDYNVEVAIEAAKLGFKEIQFDYVRFPEGFERLGEQLDYSMGDYAESNLDPVQRRVEAVTDFVAYAKEKLEPYDVEVSVDIFGYAATLPEAPGIGQNFSKISENVDVISSMIYPSHWTSYFGIAKPDLEPYKLVAEYAKVENEVLSKLDEAPVSRPWLQDFTASYLGAGNYKRYGKAEVEAQIRALNEQGIDEFLLWNAGNSYSPGVDYTPE
ncbi:putative glycoside hydrolase [Planococcus sp. CP5-4]|uniref:putative glycoside hydrolase n=1 Tax=unclassified Planococcus (in: firmicutes) TaxID=2662419 RepID=UPI001C233801|nr:putative glycoside hydrolase [Planococcus sp. CP5-4]MBU9673751.1 putative glycoside hydrolase [Planococcus sp. CP5-4_YE]MBV0907833.1 putative glycoside hydrolase [Planococcus sp. CP5-4_UN]MBW6063000.1 putative glycoside hydrolase [Planococcus sp. CP5-4]